MAFSGAWAGPESQGNGMTGFSTPSGGTGAAQRSLSWPVGWPLVGTVGYTWRCSCFTGELSAPIGTGFSKVKIHSGSAV